MPEAAGIVSATGKRKTAVARVRLQPGSGNITVNGRTRFEHDYKRPHHHHLVCEECNRAIEFFSPEFERLQERIVTQYQFKPLRHKLQIFGICQDCQQQSTGERPVYDSDVVFARDALRIAMATEERGINFYTTAAEIVTDE